jgi:transposase
MVGGAMAKTASAVKQSTVNSIASRQNRISENGVSAQTTKVFKSDPSKLTNEDLIEIRKRVARGEKISF